MGFMARFYRSVVLVLLALAAVNAQAQFRVEVSGIGLTQLPVAVAAFRGDESAPQKIAAIVQADLQRSGQFRLVDAADMGYDESTRPDMAIWRQRNADPLGTGSVVRLADGRFDIRFRLRDMVRGQDVGGQSCVVSVNKMFEGLTCTLGEG